MNFNKYELYENVEYIELLMQKNKLEKNKNIYTYTLRDKDRKIIDTVKLTQKEVDEGKDNNLSYANYTRQVGSNKEITELITNKEKEIQEFREEFYKNVKSIFVQDFSTYKNISIAKAYILLKYTITNLNLLHNEVKEALSYEDIEYYATWPTYEETMQTSYNISASGFETLYNHMSNNLNLLSLKV